MFKLHVDPDGHKVRVRSRLLHELIIRDSQALNRSFKFVINGLQLGVKLLLESVDLLLVLLVRSFHNLNCKFTL